MHVYTGEAALHEYLRTKAVTVEYWMKPVVEKTALPWLQLEVAGLSWSRFDRKSISCHDYTDVPTFFIALFSVNVWSGTNAESPVYTG